jgi:hypothetical protein
VRYTLADSNANTPTAIVDDLVLHRGGDPVDLTDEQASRLRAAGVNLRKQGDGDGEDYEGWPKGDLEAEATRRSLAIAGTGTNGNVVVSDLVAALKADDNDNPQEA